jgi:hypothetical protein
MKIINSVSIFNKHFKSRFNLFKITLSLPNPKMNQFKININENEGFCTTNTIKKLQIAMRMTGAYMGFYIIFLKDKQPPVHEKFFYFLGFLLTILEEYLIALFKKKNTKTPQPPAVKLIFKFILLTTHLKLSLVTLFTLILETDFIILQNTTNILALLIIIFVITLIHPYYAFHYTTIPHFAFFLFLNSIFSPQTEPSTTFDSQKNTDFHIYERLINFDCRILILYGFIAAFGFSMHFTYSKAFLRGAKVHGNINHFLKGLPYGILVWEKEQGILYENYVVTKIFPELCERDRGFNYLGNKIRKVRKNGSYVTLQQILGNFITEDGENSQQIECEYSIKSRLGEGSDDGSILLREEKLTKSLLITLFSPTFLPLKVSAVVIMIRDLPPKKKKR